MEERDLMKLNRMIEILLYISKNRISTLYELNCFLEKKGYRSIRTLKNDLSENGILINLEPVIYQKIRTKKIEVITENETIQNIIEKLQKICFKQSKKKKDEVYYILQFLLKYPNGATKKDLRKFLKSKNFLIDKLNYILSLIDEDICVWETLHEIGCYHPERINDKLEEYE